MKRLAFVIFVLGSLIVAGQALGETPAKRAVLEMLDAEGTPMPPSLTKFTLVMNKQGEKVVSFTLTETYGSPCPPGAMCILGFREITREFKVTHETLDRCASTVYSAQYMDKKKGRMSRAISRLAVRDHSRRICMDLRPYGWDVALTEASKLRRTFGGNPEAIQQTADCASITQNTICTMEFAPATCSAFTLNHEPLKPSISAEGGNPCAAMANVRAAACERGLDWQALRDEEIHCGFKMCPVFMCAAPPVGCSYVPDNKVDERGCPASCGALVCQGGPDTISPDPM